MTHDHTQAPNFYNSSNNWILKMYKQQFLIEHTHLRASGSDCKACNRSELIDAPPLLVTVSVLVKPLLSRDWVTEDELVLLQEGAVASSSSISSITKPN